LTKDDLAKLGTVTSVEGSPIKVNCDHGFEVKNATVLTADIDADNGMIHVIDTVNHAIISIDIRCQNCGIFDSGYRC
jgi:uncharacterized surface protein with fasciclin (FAS1) repeats